MSKSKMENGIWFREVPLTWKYGDEWRVDIPKAVLEDPQFKAADFRLEDPIAPIRVRVLDTALKKALTGISERLKGRTLGPFDINPYESTINGRKVLMTVFDDKRNLVNLKK